MSDLKSEAAALEEQFTQAITDAESLDDPFGFGVLGIDDAGAGTSSSPRPASATCAEPA